MHSNKHLVRNPQKCEKYLSDFGKKVLHELMNQWDKAKEQKTQNNHRQQYSQIKKVLNFKDETKRNSTLRSLPPIEIYNTEELFDLNVTNAVTPEETFDFNGTNAITLEETFHLNVANAITLEETFHINVANAITPEETFHINVTNVIPVIPTSEELPKTLQLNEPIENTKFAHPTMFTTNIVQQHNTSHDDEFANRLFKKVNTIYENITNNDTTVVNWENMFDSELLDDKPVNIIENNNDSLENKDNTFNLNPGNIEKRSGKRKNKPKSNDNPKTIKKLKKVNNNQYDLHKKSTKEGEGTKASFRKQKYTKTVKNWLNDVESFNPNNDEIASNFESIINVKQITSITDDKHTRMPQNTSTNNKPKVTIDKSVKDNKKVVQACLANKDGVMKFCKPKKDITEPNKEEGNTKIVKDKKDKVTKKFFPPIKSQIPVKDITYNIITVDDRNVDECCINLIRFEEEITANLIYSNGFCQLNSHFTDGTCVADGLLFSTGDMFYCFKSAGQKTKDALTRLLNSKIIISYEGHTVLIYLTTHLQMEINTINMYDAKIGASLLDPDNPPGNFSDLQKLLSSTPTYTIATECTLQKAAWYMTLLRDCWSKLNTMLVDNQLWQVFVDVEMKLLPIIADMERRGVSIDLAKLKSMEEVLVDRMRLVEEQCYKAAGKVFQINSTAQVRGIIYDELQLDAKCNVKIKETLSGGVKSTSETMLRSLISVHPLPRLILEYRRLHKAHATFLAGIAHHVSDGFVRPTWVQTAAATGRIASNNPNLQAIPKTPFSLVMFPDADQTADVEQLNLRSVYVSREGWRLVAADFQHVECRVFALAAAESALLRALDHHHDIFKLLAAQWLQKAERCVSPSERSRCKRLVYASLYGAGTRKLMDILDVGYEQALQIAASFNRTFPSLKAFGRAVVSRCSAAGGRLSTARGRVRHFANISSDDFTLRSHAERQAVNFVVQGSAADLCKTAMILTEAALRKCSPPVLAHLVLQIHDELVWEVHERHVHMAAGIIKHVMEGCGQQCGMSMTLPVAITVGKNWGEMEDYTPVCV